MIESDVTVIVPTLATKLSKRALGYCLNSLQDMPNVVIAHNGEDDNTEKATEVHNKLVKPLLEKSMNWFSIGEIRGQGQCNAVNHAVRKFSHTKWIMISNDDMVYPEGWFKKFTDVVDNFGLLVASPNLVEPRKGAPPFIEHFCGGVGIEESKPDFDKQCFIDFESSYKEHINKPMLRIEDGFNFPLLIRKDVWDTIGGYDTAFDPWGSNGDSDLQHKIMLAGITPKRVRECLVYHFSQTSGTFHPDNQAALHENYRYFEEKWGFQRANSPEIWYKPEIDYGKLKYKPEWEGKYE